MWGPDRKFRPMSKFKDVTGLMDRNSIFVCIIAPKEATFNFEKRKFTGLFNWWIILIDVLQNLSR